MGKYQTFDSYNGTMYGVPEYRGIEYNEDIPDHVVIGSPGGYSSTHHHWTGGFYGRGGSSGDIYTGQGREYISGIHGNAYSKGHSYSGQNAPDEKFWENSKAEIEETPIDIIENYTPIESSPRKGGDEGIKWLALILVVVLLGIASQYLSRGSREVLKREVFDGKMDWKHCIAIGSITVVLAGVVLYLFKGYM